MEIESDARSLIGIFTTDAELVVRVWDDAMFAITGLASRDSVGKHLTEVVPDLEARGLLARFELVRDLGTSEVLAPAFHKYLIPHPPRSTSVHFAEMQQLVRISALRDEDGVQGLMVVVEDVTERMEQERELAAQLRNSDDGVRLKAAKAISGGSDKLSSAEAKPVIDALSDKSWRVRRQLVDGLAHRAAPDAVAALLAAVREEHLDFGMLNSALQVLQATSVDTSETLIEFLRGDDADLRMQAALALGQQKNPASAVHLIATLRDENENVRYHAIEALGKMKAADAVEPLLEIAESRDFFLSFAALDALKQIGERSIAPRVMPLIEDESLRDAAVGTLGATADIAAVAPIVGLLNDGGISADVAANALSALYDRCEADPGSQEQIAERVRETIGKDGVSALISALDAVVGGAGDEDTIRVAGWIRRDDVRRALSSLLEKDGVRQAAAKSLVSHGEKAVDYFVEKLKSDQPEARQTAARALGEIDSELGVAALINALHTNPAIGLITSQALGGSTGTKVFDTLLNMLGTDDAAVRRSVVNTLRTLARPDLAPRLCSLLSEVDPNVRESVVRIIGHLDSTECEAAVVACCDDPNELVRIAALEQLPNFAHAPSVELLTGALTDDVPRVRATAVQTLGKFESDESVRALRSALGDADPWTRYFAIRSLSGVKDVHSLDRFRDIASGDEAEQVRVAAEEAIRRVQP